MSCISYVDIKPLTYSLNHNHHRTAAESALALSHADLALLRNAGKVDLERAYTEKVLFPFPSFFFLPDPAKPTVSTFS